MKRFSSILTVLIALLAPTSAMAEGDRLVLTHPGAPGSLLEISALEFARRANEKLPPPHRVTVASNPALGDGLALLDSVKNGRAAFALASSALISVSDRFALFELPLLIRKREQIAAIRSGLLDRYLQPAAGRKGFLILGVWENGFRHFTNDLQPLRGGQDLKKLRIAVPPANIWRERLIRLIGAEPVPLAARALPDALKTQIVDGQEAPLNDIAALNLAASQRHLSLSDHLYSPAFLIADKNAFDSLPPAIRDVIAAEAVAIEPWIQAAAIQLESDLLDRLDRDMELANLSAAAFRSARLALYKDFAQTVPVGLEMIEILLAAPQAEAAAQAAGEPQRE